MSNVGNNIRYSGFSSMPDGRYYNLYKGSQGIKGDATNADGTAGFYNDLNGLNEAWIDRGGYHGDGSGAGPFHYYGKWGANNNDNSTHFALATW